MNLKPFQRIPLWVTLGVIALVCFVRYRQFDFCERLERITFDLRARTAQQFPSSVATNLGFVFINEESVRRVWDGSLGYNFGLYWPRQVYGRIIDELSAQGARAVAFDVLFGELRPDHALVKMADGSFQGSDEFFAHEMRRAGNVIIAITPEVAPPLMFTTNAAALGDIETDKDSDGILRRVRAFRLYRRWHPAFLQLDQDPDYGVDLRLARVEPRQIVLPRRELGDIAVPLDPEGNFDLADFGGDQLPSGVSRKAKPFTEQRVWHMGLVLAARELGLNLAGAEIDLARGQIVLRGAAGVERVVPVDRDGYFYVDWCMPDDHPALTEEAIHHVLAQARRRAEGGTNEVANRWRGKLVVVGSSGVIGNNLTDRGATPLRSDTLLVSKHWNVANSVITGRFVRRSPLAVDLALIALLGVIASVLTCRLRVLTASALTAVVWVAYTIGAFVLYNYARYWIPIFLPLTGALLITHVSLVTWRVVFEQAERRRLKSVFSTIVSPKIVHELLQAKKLALGGARREVTILFADVRGFTEFTDASQERVADFVRKQRLTGPAAEACFDAQARETLDTINLYLGCVADTVLQQDGTLDKFIGDCVMAFWGAPTPNAKHALACVRAALDAQRAVDRLNRQREAENQRREAENALGIPNGHSPQPPLPILLLGTGINTGMATVGLMGSEAKAGVRQGSYTVFGREVNLASRLEGVSGRGRIFISQTTFDHLQRDDPQLAATCLSLPPVTVKGIRTPVEIYEVPWRESATAVEVGRSADGSAIDQAAHSCSAAAI